MRISALSIRDFKGIKEVSIDCDREVIILAGKNGQGKSSALDAITALLMGKGTIPAEPIRRGEDSGEISATIDGFVVKRTFTRKDDGSFGGSLTITSADGARYPSPQSWLDARINALGCDPLAFIASKPAKQAATLREIAGVDTTALDLRRKATFDSRTEIGRVDVTEKGALDTMPSYPDAPADVVEPVVVSPEIVSAAVVSAADIVAELAAADATALARRDADRMVDDLTGAAGRKIAERDRLAAEATELRRKVMELEAAVVAAAEDAARQTAAAANASDAALRIEVTDRTPIAARLADVEQTNAAARAEAAEKNAAAIREANEANANARREADALNAKVRANAARKAQEERVTAGRTAYAAKTAELASIDAERAAMLAAAKFPIAGLGFATDGTVTYDGLPLAQVNEATRIRVAMAISLAGDKALKLVLIRNASGLDDDGMQLVADLAREADAQLWLERVPTTDPGAVIIRDGGVA